MDSAIRNAIAVSLIAKTTKRLSIKTTSRPVLESKEITLIEPHSFVSMHVTAYPRSQQVCNSSQKYQIRSTSYEYILYLRTQANLQWKRRSGQESDDKLAKIPRNLIALERRNSTNTHCLLAVSFRDYEGHGWIRRRRPAWSIEVKIH